MPLIKLNISKTLEDKTKEELAKMLITTICNITGKPEGYTMAIIEDNATILFAGKDIEGAFVEVKGIGGLTPEINKKLSATICKLLKEKINIMPENVYLNFTDVPATNWGWKGETFG